MAVRLARLCGPWGAAVLVIDDPVLAGHLALALDEHVKKLRRQGYELEWRSLLALRDACLEANRGGQSRPNGGRGFSLVDNVPVREIEAFERPAFVDYATAGRMLGVSARTVRRRVREGKLAAGGPSKRSMIAVVDVERYKQSLRSNGVSVAAPGSPSLAAPGAASDSAKREPSAVEKLAVPFHQPADGFLSSSFATARGRTLDDAFGNLGAVEHERQMWWRHG